MEWPQLKQALSEKIEAGNDEVISFIKTFGKPGYRVHNEVENVVLIVLELPQVTNEAVEAACQAFYDIGTEGGWVHSLSHFTDRMWRKRNNFSACIPWLKKYYETAFRLARNGNDSCCDRLVDHFCYLSKYDDDPAEFHLVESNLSWWDWDGHRAHLERIKHGVFDSAEDLEKFMLLTRIMFRELPETMLEKSSCYVFDIAKIELMVKRLDELGSDFSRYHGFSKLLVALLKENINKLEENIQKVESWVHRSAEEKAEIQRQCRQDIAKFENQLSQLK